jgi:protein-S-isoprenylcysteine O-methyltransferase Ste14
MTPNATFRIVFWVLLGLVLVMRVYFTSQTRRAGERVLPDQAAIQREGKVVFATRVVLFCLLIGFLALYAVRPDWVETLSIPIPDWLRWAGFILGLGSLALWTWVQAVLGKQWSAQLQLRGEHRLVTTGPYARVRHPLYTAMFGYALSLALVTANWIFVILTLAIIFGLAARVSREEQMMIEAFGEEYRAYMHTTGRFFPK